MENKSLENLRERIDEIDNQIVDLLAVRMEIVKEIGLVKKNDRSTIYRPDRERQIIDRLHKRLPKKDIISYDALEAIFLEVFATSRNIETPERVAYLGAEGSFAHQAAESRFGAIGDYSPVESVEEIFKNVERGTVRFGVVPIENNREGTFNETVDMLCEYKIKIVAEVPISIQLVLAGAVDHKRQVKTIFARNIEFKYCSEYLKSYFRDVERVSCYNMREAIKKAKDTEGGAAICSHVAAKQQNLPVFVENVQNRADTRTRFLVISRDIINEPSGTDKTTILVKIPDEPGALVSFLDEFRKCNINLNKLESRPSKEKNNNFKYWFFIEFDGYFEDQPIARIIEKYRDKITVMGSYVKMC